MPDYTDSQCGTCLHWHRSDPDPLNLGHVQGQCRRWPCGCGVPQHTPRGVALQVITVYLSVPPDFPACAGYEGREEP